MRLLRLWVVGFEWHHFLGGTAFALLLLQGLVEFELGGSCFQGCVVNSIFFKTSGFLDEFEVICPCSESRSLANSSPFSCYLALWFWVTPSESFPLLQGLVGIWIGRLAFHFHYLSALWHRSLQLEFSSFSAVSRTFWYLILEGLVSEGFCGL